MQIGLCLRRHIEEKKKNFLHYLVQCSNLLCIQPHKKFLLSCGMQKFAFLYQVGRDLYIRTQHSTLTQFAAILLCHKVHASVYSECKNQLNINSIRELKDEEKSVRVLESLHCISEQFWGRMDCQSNQATICLSFYYYSQRQIVFELVILVLHDIKYQSLSTLCPKMHNFNFVSLQVDFEKFFSGLVRTLCSKFFGACYCVSN